jgi:hypothetical protein
VGATSHKGNLCRDLVALTARVGDSPSVSPMAIERPCAMLATIGSGSDHGGAVDDQLHAVDVLPYARSSQPPLRSPTRATRRVLSPELEEGLRRPAHRHRPRGRCHRPRSARRATGAAAQRRLGAQPGAQRRDSGHRRRHRNRSRRQRHPTRCGTGWRKCWRLRRVPRRDACPDGGFGASLFGPLSPWAAVPLQS